MYFLVLLFLACAVVASAAKTSFRYSPELYFKKGEKYKILGTETLAIVVEDLDRQHAHSKTPKLAIKLCKGIGVGKHTCMLPMSIISLGLPTTKKTLLFNGINVAVQLDQAEKSITLIGLLGWCNSDYCGGQDKNEIGRVTFVPTTESPQVLIESNPTQFQPLHVSNGFSDGSGPAMIAGADNQLIAISGYQKPVSFFTIGDGKSTELQEPTSTQLLIPVGDTAGMGDQYTLPTFYDGTQYWLRCRCGGDKDLRSSLDKNLVWSFPDVSSTLGDSPLVYANGIVWLQDDRNSMSTFKRYNSATRQPLSDFHVNSALANSYYGGFTVSSDGSILYLVNYDRDAKSLDILSISTTTNAELNLIRGKVPLAAATYRNVRVCGTAMTSKGVAVCLYDGSKSSAKTMFVPIYAV